MNATVTVKMNDILNSIEVERTIDIVNIMSSGDFCWELKGKEDQRANLERWIEERANDQHDTILDLIDWTIN